MANYNRNWRNSRDYPEWEEHYNNPYSEFRNRNRGNMIYGQDYGYQNRSQYDDRGRTYREQDRDRDYNYDSGNYDYEGQYNREYDEPGQALEDRGRRYSYLNDDRSDYAYGGYGRSGLGGAYDVDERYRRGKYARRQNERSYNPNDRSWWNRAGDEVSSWFGDEDAERRRHMDRRYGAHRGKGPRGYNRSDERIHEDINDRLSDDPFLDASDIEVSVNNREVTLSGKVDTRTSKRRAEDIVESVSGVTHIENRMRVRQFPTAEEREETTREKSRSNKYDEIQV